MRNLLLGAGLAGLFLACAPAQAATFVDATGDFLPTYTGPDQDDLDVTSFSVFYNLNTQIFHVTATMADVIDLNTGGFYVIGVNTGAAVGPGPFNSLGQGNVIFNSTIQLRKTGNSTANGNVITAIFAGNRVSADVPLSLLPAGSNGFTPLDFGFNIWPRSGAGGLNVISDFAPENANLTATAVPEPASWAMLVMGLGAVGATLRTRRRMTLGNA